MERAAELLSRERMASKQNAVAVREPLTRAAVAAAPLMRCSDPAVVTAAEVPHPRGVNAAVSPPGVLPRQTHDQLP